MVRLLEPGLPPLGATGQIMTMGPSGPAWLDSVEFNVKHPRFGAKGDGTTNDTAAVQAAITAAQAVTGGGTVVFPAGTYLVSGVTVSAAGITFRGLGRSASVLKSTSGDVVTLTSATKFVCEHLKVWSGAAGGHCFTVTDSLSHGLWYDLTVQQDNAAKSVLQADDANAGTLNYIDNLWEHVDTQHAGSASVPTFNLRGGAINRNLWRDIRPTYSGNYTWLIETTAGGSYANDNAIECITGEILNGGLVKLLGCRHTRLSSIGLYDLGTTTRDLIFIGNSTATPTLATVYTTLMDVERIGGTLGGGLYDLNDAGTNGASATVLINCGSQAQGFQVNANSHRLFALGGNVTYTNGNYASQITLTGGLSTFSDPISVGGSGTSYLRVKGYTTAGRPTAATAGAGGMYYDTTLGKPIFSDGTNWRDATGTVV